MYNFIRDFIRDEMYFLVFNVLIVKLKSKYKVI
jgi:hypothetical protein